MKLLCKLADSFIYVVSRMGVTGASGTLNTGLPDLLKRVKEYSGDKPAAVGFGVSTRDHFLSVAKIADGVVIGSQIITTLAEAAPGQGAKAVEEYCAMVGGRRGALSESLTREVGIVETMHEAAEPDGKNVHVDGIIRDSGSEPGLADQIEALNTDGPVDPAAVPARFGEFGGQYVPESLMDCLSELEEGFNIDTGDFPEQVKGAAVDGRSDVFSVGLVLWECLAGSRCYDALENGELFRRVS